jgi:hypothetical protein
MNESDLFIESLDLKVKTRKEVANEYGTTAKTLIRRLVKEGLILPHGAIFPSNCRKIYYKLGIPASIKANSGGNNKNNQ